MGEQTSNEPTAVVIREGASLRTSDELRATFVGDATDLGVKLSTWGADLIERVWANLNANERMGVMWLSGDNAGDELDMELGTLVNQCETALYELGYSVRWDDGYVIYRGEVGEEDYWV